MVSGWILVGESAAISLFVALIFVILTYRFVVARWKKLPDRISALEEWRAQAEESARMSDLGRRSAEARAEYKEEFAQAMAEGRKILSGPGSAQEKQKQILAAIPQYPHVARKVAQKLNDEYGISRALGISEDALIAYVANLAANIKTEPQQEAQGGLSSDALY